MRINRILLSILLYNSFFNRAKETEDWRIIHSLLFPSLMIDTGWRNHFPSLQDVYFPEKLESYSFQRRKNIDFTTLHCTCIQLERFVFFFSPFFPKIKETLLLIPFYFKLFPRILNFKLVLRNRPSKSDFIQH